MKMYSRPRWDWPAAALIIAVVFTAAVRLDATGWTPNLGQVEALAVMGAILGMLLGLSNFKKYGIRRLIWAYSVAILPIYLSRIVTGEETAMGRIISLAGRLWASISLILEKKPVEDYIFFVTLMSILFWGIGIYSGYQLIRSRSILKVLTPSILPMVIIQYYDGYKAERIWGLAFYFFLGLLLTGRLNLLNSRDDWEKNDVVAGSDPEFDLNKYIVSVAAVIILAAWMIPSPGNIYPAAARAWREWNEPFENFRNQMDDVLAALNSGRLNTTTNEMYGSAMGLGRAAGNSSKTLFSVYAPQKDIPRFYWRMRAYDLYKNGTWEISYSQSNLFDPGQGDFIPIDLQKNSATEFTFIWQAGQSILLATPQQPVWVSRQGSVQITPRLDGQIDQLSWMVLPAIRSGDQYQVRATQPNPTQKELRESGSEYPEWVSEHYLQVPESNASAFKNLAEEITSGLPNNFDKAEAITKYLRQTITYSETIPAPPSKTDPLNWFLLNWRSGFCNYYASAEVLLLRSLSIPARMVVGFAEGKSEQNGVYNVRGIDAHAWPEAYFPGVGWVQFEPTTNQAAIFRPSGESGSTGLSGNTQPNPPGSIRDKAGIDRELDNFNGPATPAISTYWGLTRTQWVIISIVMIVIAGVFTWRVQRHKLSLASLSQKTPRALKAFYIHNNLKPPAWVEQWVRWSEVSSAERAFHAVNQSLSWMKQGQPGNITPMERAQLLKNLVPGASNDIDILVAALEETLFTRHQVDISNIMRASWRLRLLTVRAIIRKWLYGSSS
jgi:transglutaminase-like putative cysteine protease